jgi:hypothetical protein
VRRVAAAALVTVAVAGCGTQVAAQAPPAPRAVTAPLTTSMTTAGATWAVLVMGGSAASENNFWQVFARTSGSWSLVTPPGVADNGGLVAAGAGGSLLVGIRPSQGLEFTPLATTTDQGARWSAGVLDAALADVPDALAVTGTRQLALLTNLTTEQTAPGTARWSALPRAACQLSAVSYTPSGEPLAGGDCGVFRYSGGGWRSASPPRSGLLLRLTATSSGNVALLVSDGDLYAAWTRDGGIHWSMSAPLPLPPSAPGASFLSLASAAFGSGTSVGVLLSGGKAATTSGPGAAWTTLPAVPSGTAVLALDPVQALAVTGGSKLTVWQLAFGTWTRHQSITVPIGYGSSS